MRNVSEFQLFLLTMKIQETVFKIAVVWSTFSTCVNLIYTLMVSDADIIGFIAKLDGNSKVSSRQP